MEALDHKLIAITKQITRCDGKARFRSSLLCVCASAISIASVGIAVSNALSTVPDSICGDISENSLSCISSQDIWVITLILSGWTLNRTVLVQQPFWMYQPQQFLEIAKTKLLVEINPQSVEEVNTIAKVEADKAEIDEVIQILQQSPTLATKNNRLELSSLETFSELDRILQSFAEQPSINNTDLINSLYSSEARSKIRRTLQSFAEQPSINNTDLINSLYSSEARSKIRRTLQSFAEQPSINNTDLINSLYSSEARSKIRRTLQSLEE